MRLPRGYLSYSAYTLWKSNKEAFRKRYYHNEEGFSTIETRFGKKIAKMIENGWCCEGLMCEGTKEYKIEIEIVPGLTLLGFIDNFIEDTLSIVEYKSGHKCKKGKAPWNSLKVFRHKQLDFYSLLVLLKFGKFNPKTHLQWLETEFKKEVREFAGIELKELSKGSGLKLTGHIETFDREIEDWELDVLKEDIIKVAEEINQDYEKFRNNK